MQKDAEIGPAGPGTEQPRGSFTGAKALDDIQRKRTEQAIERGRAGEESDDGKDEKQTERERQIDELLPKEVASALGAVSFETFKKMYKEVWDQIESKEHLAKGFCTYTREIAKDLSVTFRTLRTNETRVVNQYAPDPNERDFSKYMDTDSEYRQIQLAIGIQAFDGKESAPLELPKGDFEEWKKSQIVIERFNWLDGLPEELVALMSGVLGDVTIAYRLALRENLKKPISTSLAFLRARLIAKGVRLSEWDTLEQVDILEAEKRNLMIEFGKEAINIMATAQDKDHAISLINHLKKIFFVDEGRKDKAHISKQADELIRLSQLTYRIAPKAGRANLEITNENE